MKDIELLLKKAAEIHNSKNKDERLVLCISGMMTQMQTLQSMKKEIMDNARRQCRKINNWTNNIEEELRENIKEYETNRRD